MKADGVRQERETILNFNEIDDTASIWTASDVTYRRLLKRLGSEYLAEDGPRHAIFVFPAKWITLPRKRATKPLTEAQRVSLSKGSALRRSKSEPVDGS